MTRITTHLTLNPQNVISTTAIPTTQSQQNYLNISNNNLMLVANDTFKNSTTSMNRNSNIINHDSQQDNNIEMYQQSRISPVSNNSKQNANLEWTKLIQTATKAFESKS